MVRVGPWPSVEQPHITSSADFFNAVKTSMRRTWRKMPSSTVNCRRPSKVSH